MSGAVFVHLHGIPAPRWWPNPLLLCLVVLANHIRCRGKFYIKIDHACQFVIPEASLARLESISWRRSPIARRKSGWWGSTIWPVVEEIPIHLERRFDVFRQRHKYQQPKCRTLQSKRPSARTEGLTKGYIRP